MATQETPASAVVRVTPTITVESVDSSPPGNRQLQREFWSLNLGSSAAANNTPSSDPDPYFTSLLNGYTANEKIIHDYLAIFGQEASESEFISHLQTSNFFILVALLERFGQCYAPQRDLPTKYEQQLKKIIQLLATQTLNHTHPKYEQLMETAGMAVHSFEKHMDSIPIIKSVSILCEKMGKHLLGPQSNVLALVKLLNVLISIKKTCYIISYSPRSTELITKTLFVTTEERSATLRELAIQTLLKFVTNLNDDRIEAERFLSTHFVTFMNNCLKVVENQIAADLCIVAKLLYGTLQLSTHGVEFGLEKMSQKQLLCLIVNKIRNMKSTSDEADVEKIVSKLLGYALSSCFPDFLSSYQKAFELQNTALSPYIQRKTSPASSKMSSPQLSALDVDAPSRATSTHKSPQGKCLESTASESDSDDGEMAGATAMTRVTRQAKKANSSKGKKVQKKTLDDTSEEDGEVDYEDFLSPRPITKSIQKLLNTIPANILNMHNATPSKLAVKSLKYLFTDEELVNCMLPPIGALSDRREFPKKKVDALFGLLERKFPDVDPLIYVPEVKAAVGVACRGFKKRFLASQKNQ